MSLNLYSYCANEPVMYTDPSGNTAANLNDLAIASGAKKEDIIWNGKDKEHPQGSATVTVNGVETTITVGKDGVYIKDNRIVIDNNLFDSKFKNGNVSISTVVTDTKITASRTVITGNNRQTSLIGSHDNNYRKDTNKHNSNAKKDNTKQDNGAPKYPVNNPQNTTIIEPIDFRTFIYPQTTHSKEDAMNLIGTGFFGGKCYYPEQLSDIPNSITYKYGDYIYKYEITQYCGNFFGVSMPTNLYSYQLTWTNEPPMCIGIIDVSGLGKIGGGLSQGMSSTLKISELNTTHNITMSKNKFKSFVETIKNEGINEPIKYVEYNGQKYVVDGHHRLQAAKQLGIKDVPVQKVELPYAGYKTVDDLFWGD